MWPIDWMYLDEGHLRRLTVDDLDGGQLDVADTLRFVSYTTMVDYAIRRLLAGDTSMALCEIASGNGHYETAVDQHLADLGLARRRTHHEAEADFAWSALDSWRSGRATAWEVVASRAHYDRVRSPDRDSSIRSALADLAAAVGSCTCDRCLSGGDDTPTPRSSTASPRTSPSSGEATPPGRARCVSATQPTTPYAGRAGHHSRGSARPVSWRNGEVVLVVSLVLGGAGLLGFGAVLVVLARDRHHIAGGHRRAGGSGGSDPAADPDPGYDVADLDGFDN